MNTLVLDASILIDLERAGPAIKALKELQASYPGTPHISFVVYVEYLYGLEVKSPINKAAAILFIERIPILKVTKTTAQILVKLRHKYKTHSLSDLFTAAQAIENNFILITKDHDFAAIEELDKIIIV